MRKIYTALSDFNEALKADTEAFLSDFEGSSPEDYLQEVLNIYLQMANWMEVAQDDFQNYHLYLKGKHEFQDIDLAPIIEKCTCLHDPWTDYVNAYHNENPDADIDEGISRANHIFGFHPNAVHWEVDPKVCKQLWYSFTAIIQDIGKRLNELSPDYSMFTGLETKYTEEELSEIFRQSGTFIEGDERSFIAFCTPEPLPSDFKPLVWRLNKGKSPVHKSAAVEYFGALIGKLIDKVFAIPAKEMRVINCCVKDIEGNPINIRERKDRSAFQMQIEKIFGIKQREQREIVKVRD